MNFAIKSALRRGFLSTEEHAIIKGNGPMMQQQRRQRQQRQKPLPLSPPHVDDGPVGSRDSAEVATSNSRSIGPGSKRRRLDSEAKEPSLKKFLAMDSGTGANLEGAHSSGAADDAKPRGLRSQERRRNVHGLKLDLQTG
jgi:hypothetical protein